MARRAATSSVVFARRPLAVTVPPKAKKILHLYPSEQRVFQLFQFDPTKFAERVYQDLHEPERIGDFEAYYRPYYTSRSPKPVSVEAFQRTHYIPSHPDIHLWLNPGSDASETYGDTSDHADAVIPPTLIDIQFLLWQELVHRVVMRQK